LLFLQKEHVLLLSISSRKCHEEESKCKFLAGGLPTLFLEEKSPISSLATSFRNVE